MIVLLTGATGNVGRALARRLRREGHSVIAAVRSVTRARNALGPEIELTSIENDSAMRAAIERADAVVNLAGEGIADERWSSRRKRDLVASRVDVTRRLATWIREASSPPKVFVSASAIGIYPSAGAAVQDEYAQPGRGFLADLCAAWEGAALGASAVSRVVCLRIGIVLDAEAGALRQILPIFRLGLGGRLGDGNQYISWIHLDDLLEIVAFALQRDDLTGVVNATAPGSVTNAEWTRGLAALVERPAFIPVPAFVLRLALGGRAQMLLASQRIAPRALERAGYRHLYPTLDSALSEIRERLEESTRIEPYSGRDAGVPRGATHVLTQVTNLSAPLEEVFPFFSRAANLGWITPSWMGFSIVGQAPEIREGTIIEYDIRLGPLPLRWRTRIAVFDQGVRFVDNQERGPYSIWWHEHSFEAVGDSTRMIDRVYFRLPLGSLGHFFAGQVIHDTLRRIFGYRAQAMAQRFGAARRHAAVNVFSHYAAE